MINEIKKQFLEIQQEKDPVIKLKKLKKLKKKLIFHIINSGSEIKSTNEIEKLLDPKSICKN